MSRRKKSATNPRTVIGIIQDKSGSMAIRISATLSGYNEYLQTLKKEAEGDVQLTLTQFDTSVDNVFTNRKLEDCKDLTHEDYVIGGATALYDAVGKTIHAMEPTVRKDDKVVVVVMTDGQENSSLEFTFKDITALLDKKRGVGWEIIFLGAGEDSWAVGQSLGFDYAHSINYSGIDAHDHAVAFNDLAVSNSAVTRGATAQAASQYLSSSSTKMALETKAQNEVGHTHSSHTPPVTSNNTNLWVPDGTTKAPKPRPRRRSRTS